MTASPLSPVRTRVREDARQRRRAYFPALRLVLCAAILLTFAFASRALAADPIKGEVTVSTDGGYARLVFQFEKEVPATIRITFPIMVVTFKSPVAVSVDRLSAGAPDYISAARLDPDGSAIRIALVHKIKVNSIPAAERLYVDLLPETWTGANPGLPREVIDDLANRALKAESLLRVQRNDAAGKKTVPPAIRVKVAKQPTFTRYVFELPDGTDVVPDSADGKLALKFDRAIKWDLADARADMPTTLKSVDDVIEPDSVSVVFTRNGAPTVKTFREGRSIAVDVAYDGARVKRAAEQGSAKDAGGPAIAPPETVPVKDATAAEPNAEAEPPVPNKEAASAAAAPRTAAANE